MERVQDAQQYLVGSKPASMASFSSLPDTSTAPLPSAARCFMISRLLFAFTA